MDVGLLSYSPAVLGLEWELPYVSPEWRRDTVEVDKQFDPAESVMPGT